MAKKKTKKPLKKSARKIKEQKELIRAIRTPERFFQIEFGRYGGEVAMGSITEAQFDYWYDKGSDAFGEYMANVGFDSAEANKDVPKDAQFHKEFYEYEDICHLSGPELSDGQTMIIKEVDKDGNALQDEAGNYLDDPQFDMKDFKKLGVKVKCVGDHHSGSRSCQDVYYIFGQYFNKGGWYTEDKIKTGPRGIDFKKLEINYENADGFKVFNEIVYDGTSYYLQEDSTGKSSSFYVMEGDNV
jgi:hypothetical protein